MDQLMDLTFNYGQTNRYLEKNPILEVLADLKIDAFFSLYFCLFGSVPPFNRVVKKYF